MEQTDNERRTPIPVFKSFFFGRDSAQKKMEQTDNAGRIMNAERRIMNAERRILNAEYRMVRGSYGPFLIKVIKRHRYVLRIPGPGPILDRRPDWTGPDLT